eukprot:scaffold14882_cov102-Skeletonema_marinoi.AAC.3
MTTLWMSNSYWNATDEDDDIYSPPIFHPTQHILNRLACGGRIKATNLESSLSINAQSLRLRHTYKPGKSLCPVPLRSEELRESAKLGVVDAAIDLRQRTTSPPALFSSS